MVAVLESAIQAVMLVVTLVNVGLGLVIGYQAYRGFRRHDSGPMRYLSIGLILLTAVAYSFALAAYLVIRFDIVAEAFGDPLGLTYRIIQFAGLAFITYSLYKRP